jgi:hypothetical protein
MRARALSLALALAIAAGPAAAGHPLGQDRRVMGTLLAAAVGDEIRRNCPDISARLMRVWRRAEALEAYARGLGYSESEIAAFLRSAEERAVLEARRDAYLADRGVRAGDADSYCRLGRAEIAADSPIGALLRLH